MYGMPRAASISWIVSSDIATAFRASITAVVHPSRSLTDDIPAAWARCAESAESVWRRAFIAGLGGALAWSLVGSVRYA
jgi:hypothetical protein